MKTIKLYNYLEVNVNEKDKTQSCAEFEYKYDVNAYRYVPEIRKALKQENIKTDLTEYLSDEYPNIQSKVKSIKLDIENYTGEECYDDYPFGVAICEVTDDWTDADTAELKTYLKGQYSDGWGEIFEQQGIEFDHRYYEGYIYCSFDSSYEDNELMTYNEIG